MPPKKKPPAVCVSDISTFFNLSTRENNDKINTIRENVLDIVLNPPQEYLSHEEYGKFWDTVKKAFDDALKTLAEKTDISEYTSIKIKPKGGRNSHYDKEIIYYQENKIIGTRKVEFKNGGRRISHLPQFLSLQVKFGLIEETYDKFYYENYIDKYMNCDPLLTTTLNKKPSLQDYLKSVTKTDLKKASLFFSELQNRELFFQKEKKSVVNLSITDYLTKFGASIDIKPFYEKVKETQGGKHFLMWSDEKFYLDTFSDEEISQEMTFDSIKNGNSLEIKSGKVIYSLLLRWRNHKGILNPAWQISMKRNES